MEKIYIIEAKITVRKNYTVKANCVNSAITKLMEAGIVCAAPENNRNEKYSEEYDVLKIIDTNDNNEDDVDVE